LVTSPFSAARGALTVVGDVAAIAVLSARLADLPGTLHDLALAAAISASFACALVGIRAGLSCLAMTGGPRTGVPEP
jgi:hypothetical protein